MNLTFLCTCQADNEKIIGRENLKSATVGFGTTTTPRSAGNSEKLGVVIDDNSISA